MSPSPQAPAKVLVLAAPSTSYVPEITMPEPVQHAMLSSRTTSTPAESTIRRTSAFAQLRAPHGWTERSCVLPTTTVAAPRHSIAPLPVLISWNTPRSAMRFVIDSLLSENVASNPLPAVAPAAVCRTTAPAAISAMTTTAVNRVALLICVTASWWTVPPG
jgi:hypothetical protein